MFGKLKKKLDRKMRRRIRKTTAAMLLVSAITVAAIPVPDAAAAGGEAGHSKSVTTNAGNADAATGSKIPKLDPATTTIYCTGDNKFQFAYGNVDGYTNVGILVGYVATPLPDGHLDVPETLNAYVPYTDASGTNRGLAAASKNGAKPLYYRAVTRVTATRTANIPDGYIAGTTKLNYGLWSIQRAEVPEVETSTNRNRFQAGAAEVPDADGKIMTQTITYFTFNHNPCEYDTETTWNIPGVVYYTYNTDKISGTDSNYTESAAAWEYCRLPFDETLMQIGFEEGKTSFRKSIEMSTKILDETDLDLEATEYFTDATASSGGWLTGVDVNCISSQRVTTDKDGIYKINPNIDSKNTSFFTNGANIQSISLPKTLRVIADYSFYNCTNLREVTFNEGSMIAVLGESAFEGCTGMRTFKMATACAVETIGQSAFRNCSNLQTFYFPSAITAIGDKAFEGCTRLASITYEEDNCNIRRIGDDVFRNCASLKEVVLPENLEETGDALFEGCSALEHVTLPDNPNFNDLFFSDFNGCTSLKWIDVLNDRTTFKTDPAYKFNVENFKAQVGEQFYFIGSSSGACKIHNEITKEYAIAFMYRDTEIFEIIKQDEKNGSKLTYQANKEGELLSITIEGNKPFDAEVPGSVGPYPITAIGNDFKGNKNIQSIYIPNTVMRIADEAFMGCNNLGKVTFQERNKIEYIGENAFYTQDGSTESVPTTLTFVGNIDFTSVPFMYAMEPENTYNNNNQPVSHIEFSSGNPTNIHVKYDADTGKRVVCSVPEADKVMAKIYDEKDEYYQALKAALIDAGYSGTVSGNQPDESAIKARIDAIVDAYLANQTIPDDSPNVTAAFLSAIDITLPTGIQGIQKELFSRANDKNTVDETADVVENASVIPKDSNGRNDANKYLRSITMRDIEELDDYTFYGCESLETVVMYPSNAENGERIGNYAFGQCESLKSVIIPNTTSEMGIRPFADDAGVTAVYFTGESATPGASTEGENFSCKDGIIYEGNNGQRDAIVECLVERGGNIGSMMVGPEELAGITKIYPEAFMDCEQIVMVDLTNTNVEKIPEFCFANASDLTQLKLPLACGELEDYSLKDTNLKSLRVVNSNVRFPTNKVFYSSDDEDNVLHNVEVTCPAGSTAEKLMNTNAKYGWKPGNETILPSYTITFLDDDSRTVIKEVIAQQGQDVVPPTDEELAPFLAKHPGMYFDKWLPGGYSPAVKDMYVQATYTDEAPVTWTVRFVNDDLKLIVEREVLDGGVAEEPKTPTSYRGEQYKFLGWISVPEEDGAGEIQMNNITGNVMFMASYDYLNGGTSGNNPNDPNNPNNPNGGNNNDPNNPNGGNNNDPNNPNGGNNNDPNNPNGGNNGDNNNNNNSNGPLYTLTVVNGSGSGDYAEGTTVVIAAFDPNTGYEFYNWTSSEEDTNFASKTMSATTFKMPAKNLTVTANYKTKSETGNSITSRRTEGTITSAPSSNTGSVSSSNSGGSGNNGDGNSSNSGSTVEVSRPGISDTTVASATVNGSTDNFVVKVTEDGQATAAVAEALRNEYGDLENIHYFAMDISLYDETGTTKITDTSGLSVTITLPIPDELRQYAGNNKVGAVIGGNNLDKLNARFTTVNGVPCVTFTATHFSPYTVYVDTANLSDGAFDATPKTGDAIHPKWFLAVGLALFSAVLFLKKDRKVNPSAA